MNDIVSSLPQEGSIEVKMDLPDEDLLVVVSSTVYTTEDNLPLQEMVSL